MMFIQNAKADPWGKRDFLKAVPGGVCSRRVVVRARSIAERLKRRFFSKFKRSQKKKKCSKIFIEHATHNVIHSLRL